VRFLVLIFTRAGGFTATAPPSEGVQTLDFSRTPPNGYTLSMGPRVKICGVTSLRDAEAAVDAGADLLGFRGDAHGPRSIGPEEVAAIAARLPEHIVRVGVFDRAPDPRWQRAGPEAFGVFHQIQYYDDALWAETVRENWPMERKIKAFHIGSDRDLRAVANFSGTVQTYLLNINSPAPPGYPDGDAFGWELARETHQYGKKLILAGGLTPENVARAIARALPYAVDVTVGVEVEPGVKDAAKMGAFVRAVRQGL